MGSVIITDTVPSAQELYIYLSIPQDQLLKITNLSHMPNQQKLNYCFAVFCGCLFLQPFQI